VWFSVEAQLFGTHDGVLNTPLVHDAPRSSRPRLSCGVASCVAGGGYSQPLDAGPFVGPVDPVGVAADVRHIDGTFGTELGAIRVEGGTHLSFGDQDAPYHIESLHIEHGQVAFAPGDYWIGELQIDANNSVTVDGAGTVRLFANNGLHIASNNLINADGDPSHLLIYAYGDTVVGHQSTLSGFVYSQGSLATGNGSTIKGAVAGSAVVIGQSAEVSLQVGSITSMDARGDCEF
jgi:hypothetical protein